MAHNLTVVNGRSDNDEPTMPRDTDRSSDHTQLSDHQLVDLSDEAKQAEYRRAYDLQIQRRACPGCGDE